MPEATEMAAKSLHTATKVESENIEIETEIKTEEIVHDDQVNTSTQERTQSDETVNIKIKEVHVANGVSYLTDLNNLVQQYMAEFPECNQWHSDINNLLNRPRSPQTYIGLYGGTGVGKSSLINAILDGDIVQCNSMRAGTSVITIVSYNNDNEKEKRFRAEIETITHDEWIAEMRILLGDIGDIAEGNHPIAGSSSEAGIAISKLEAIFPDLDMKSSAAISFEDLVSKVSLIEILDKKHTFHASTIQKLKKKISGFTSSRGPSVDGVAAWPLVRKIQLYVKVELLKAGVNLVDMPGVCDSNAARTRVAEEYLRNLDAIWVATQQTRGVDDSTAQNLFEKSYKLQAERNGKLNTDVVSIIMTKSDDINVKEVVEDLHLEGTADIAQIYEKLAKVKSEKRDCENHEKRVSKINAKIKKEITNLRGLLKNRDNASGMKLGIETLHPLPHKRQISQITTEDSQSQPKSETIDEDQVTKSKEKLKDLISQAHCYDRIKKNLESKILILDKTCGENQADLKALCIQARNNWSIERRKSDFMNEILELREDLLQTGNEVDTSEILPPADNLSVFCISSKAYHHLRGRNSKEPLVPGFLSLEDTGIPDLQRHCVVITLKARKRNADFFLEGLEAFNATLEAWAKDNSPEPQLRLSTKGALEGCFVSALGALGKELKAIVTDTFNTAKTTIDFDISARLIKAANMAEKAMPDIVKKWFKGETKLHWATLKAICRRDGGPYANKRGEKFNFNEQISEVFERAYGHAWGRVIRDYIPGLLIPLKLTSKASFLKFFVSVKQHVKDNSPQISGRLNTSLHRINQLQKEANTNLTRVFENFKLMTSKIGNSSRRRVPDRMISVYRECSADAGRGVSLRNQKALIQHTNNIKGVLYRDIADEMTKGLYDHIDALRGSVSYTFDSMIQGIRNCLQQMLEQALSSLIPDVVRSRKVSFQKEILKLMEDLALSIKSQADHVGEEFVEQDREDNAESNESEDDTEDEGSGVVLSDEDDTASDESDNVKDEGSRSFLSQEDNMDFDTKMGANYFDDIY